MHRLFVLLVFVTSLALAQSTVESIPNQKLIDNSYVSNPDGILNSQTVAQIDTLLGSLERKTGAQVAVVVVESIGSEDIFEFAQKLFDKWGIGGKQKDAGLLLLLVKDQRTVRFHTGLGLEGVLPDVVCKRIQRDHMVPRFKEGNYNAGILAGIQETEKLILQPENAKELEEVEEVSAWVGFLTLLCITALPLLIIIYVTKSKRGNFTDSKKRGKTSYPGMRMKRWQWLVEFAGIPILIVLLFGIDANADSVALCYFSLYLYFLATLFHRLWRMQKVIRGLLKGEQYERIVAFIRTQQWYWFFMALLFPLPFLFYFFYHLARKRIYRNYPRLCKQCQSDLRRLDEKEEDEFLSKEQQLEETLKAVDYDVWQCKACTAIEVWFYLNNSSNYEPCPKCSTIAFALVNRRTTQHATYSSSGSGEEVHTCKSCLYTKTTAYTTARLTRSDNSSSSSSFSGGSSSSGGSWGGGSSGGGGASSSW